ncbi:hypothetical protein F5884DRAFT_751634 [Xylogone sp. PMI_703]|nr:hypothetical protein F5884DRAFT_751634 [Xylogone sp. PMI_703]
MVQEFRAVKQQQGWDTTGDDRIIDEKKPLTAGRTGVRLTAGSGSVFSALPPTAPSVLGPGMLITTTATTLGCEDDTVLYGLRDQADVLGWGSLSSAGVGVYCKATVQETLQCFVSYSTVSKVRYCVRAYTAIQLKNEKGNLGPAEEIRRVCQTTRLSGSTAIYKYIHSPRGRMITRGVCDDGARCLRSRYSLGQDSHVTASQSASSHKKLSRCQSQILN